MRGGPLGMTRFLHINRLPSPRVITTGAVIVVLWVSLSLGFTEADSPGEGLVNSGKRLVLNGLSIMAALAVLEGLRRLWAARIEAWPSANRRTLGIVGLLVISGVPGGLLRFALPKLFDWSLPDTKFNQGDVAPATFWLFTYVLAGYIATIYSDMLTRIHVHERTLERQVQEMKESRHALAAADDRTRKEVAELLHDTVQTQLIIAEHELTQAEELLETEPGKAGEMIARVKESIGNVREHGVRRASHTLHPSVIDLGLTAALRNLMKQVKGTVPIELTVDEDFAILDQAGGNRISPKSRLAAYRIIDEAVRNALKHASARKIAVSLALDGDNRFKATVRDDGKGFAVVTAEQGLGLPILRARAEEAGGEVRVSSAPQQGTRVEAMLPVR